jgi:PAS domain S-box-containing protein
MSNQLRNEMTAGETDKAQDDPLRIAYEALKGDDPLIQSAKQQIWRRLWARDNVVAWINMSAEIPAFCKSLHKAIPQDDVQLLEDIKMVAQRFSTSVCAFLIVELVNDRIQQCSNSSFFPSDIANVGQSSSQMTTVRSGGVRRQPISVPSAALYPWLFDSTPLGVIKVDTKGKCEYANQKFASIVGEASFVGHNVRELFPDDQNRGIIEDQLRKRFEERRPDDYDVMLTRLDNKRPVHVRIASTPVVDSLDRPVGAIAIFREVTFERAIKRITQVIATCQSSEELLRAIASEVRKVISFDQFHVAAYSRDKYMRSLFADPHLDPTFKVRWFKMSPAMAKFAARQDVDKIEDMEEYYKEPGFITLQEEDLKKQGWIDRPRSLLRCPVTRKGRVVASLSIGRRKPSPFSNSQVALFKSLPLREAVTMALYLEDKQNLRFRLDLMGSIFKEWDDQEKVASVIVQQLLEHNDWDHAAFFHVDEKRHEIRLLSQKARNDNPGLLLEAQYKQGLDSGVLGYVYKNRDSVNIGDLAHSQFKDIAVRNFKSQTASELCIPVVIDNRVCWMLNLEDSRKNAFSSEEVDYLKQILDELKNLLEGVLARHFVETTIDSASDAIIAVDGSGCISRVNPAVESLLGYSQLDLKGVTFLNLLDSRQLLDEVTDGRRLFCEQVTLKRKDGTGIGVLLSASPLPQALGGAIFLARDLSLMKRLQELEYLGRVHRELAIQTKTPLSLAFSWLDTLHTSDPETLKKIVQELQRVELTYDRLALYEQYEGVLPTNKILLDMSEETQNVLKSLPDLEQKKIDFKPVSLPWVRGDPFQLTFCVRTILSYLLRFAPEKERIDFRLQRENGLIVLRIRGILPKLSDAALPGERAESLRRVHVDIALGENILRSFIRANDGVYHQPVWEGQRIEFRIDLPGYVQETL